MAEVMAMLRFLENPTGCRHRTCQQHLGFVAAGTCNGNCDVCDGTTEYVIYEKALSVQEWAAFVNDPVDGLLAEFEDAERMRGGAAKPTPLNLIAHWTKRTGRHAVANEDMAACILINMLIRGALTLATTDVHWGGHDEPPQSVLVVQEGHWAALEGIEAGADEHFDWFGN